MKNNIIGLLGLGRRSTDFYLQSLYDTLIKEKDVEIKQLVTDYDKINKLLPKPSAPLDKIVKDFLVDLNRLNLDFIFVPNITLHETIDRIQVDANIIHPIHATAIEIKKKQHQTVILFGSKYTMQSIYIKSIFADYKVTVLLPSKPDMQFADNIRKHIYQETETQELLNQYNLMIKKYLQNNIVVIASTELSIAIKNENLKLFDIARIHLNCFKTHYLS